MTKPRIYTGIGSRSTPPEWLSFFRELALKLAGEGWTLRSGGAPGADAAFEHGASQAFSSLDFHARHVWQYAAEIFLPWHQPARPEHDGCSYISPPSAQAMLHASQIHPNWKACSGAARKLHARNVHQVMGRDLQAASTAVICWTPGGKPVGGTRTAIVLAERLGIPVYNFGGCEFKSAMGVESYVKQLEELVSKE